MFPCPHVMGTSELEYPDSTEHVISKVGGSINYLTDAAMFGPS